MPEDSTFDRQKFLDPDEHKVLEGWEKAYSGLIKESIFELAQTIKLPDDPTIQLIGRFANQLCEGRIRLDKRIEILSHWQRLTVLMGGVAVDRVVESPGRQLLTVVPSETVDVTIEQDSEEAPIGPLITDTSEIATDENIDVEFGRQQLRWLHKTFGDQVAERSEVMESQQKAELVERVVAAFRDLLSPRHTPESKQIRVDQLTSFLSGQPRAEIATAYGVDLKSIENALNTISLRFLDTFTPDQLSSIAFSEERPPEPIQTEEGEREPQEMKPPKPELTSSWQDILSNIEIGDSGVRLVQQDITLPYIAAKAAYKGQNYKEKWSQIKKNSIIVLLENPESFLYPRDILQKVSEKTDLDLKLGPNDTAILKNWITNDFFRTPEGKRIFMGNGKTGRGAAYGVNPALLMGEEAAKLEQPIIPGGDQTSEIHTASELKNEYPSDLTDVELETSQVPHTPLGDAYVMAVSLLTGDNKNSAQALKDFGFELVYKNFEVYKSELANFRPDRSAIGNDPMALARYKQQAAKNIETFMSSPAHFDELITGLDLGSYPRSSEFLQELLHIVREKREPGSLSSLLNSEWRRSGERAVLVSNLGPVRKILWPRELSGDSNVGLDAASNELVYTGENRRRSDRKNSSRRNKIDEISQVIEEVAGIFGRSLGDIDGQFSLCDIKGYCPKFNASAIKRVGLKRSIRNFNQARYSVEEVASVLILSNPRLGNLYKSEFAMNNNLINRVIQQAKARAKSKVETN